MPGDGCLLLIKHTPHPWVFIYVGIDSNFLLPSILHTLSIEVKQNKEARNGNISIGKSNAATYQPVGVRRLH